MGETSADRLFAAQQLSALESAVSDPILLDPNTCRFRAHEHPAVCATAQQMGDLNRIASCRVWNAFTPSNEGGNDLSGNRQHSGDTDFAWPY
jgi:hypothetical protein